MELYQLQYFQLVLEIFPAGANETPIILVEVLDLFLMEIVMAEVGLAGLISLSDRIILAPVFPTSDRFIPDGNCYGWSWICWTNF